MITDFLDRGYTPDSIGVGAGGGGGMQTTGSLHEKKNI